MADDNGGNELDYTSRYFVVEDGVVVRLSRKKAGDWMWRGDPKRAGQTLRGFSVSGWRNPGTTKMLIASRISPELNVFDENGRTQRGFADADLSQVRIAMEMVASRHAKMAGGVVHIRPDLERKFREKHTWLIGDEHLIAAFALLGLSVDLGAYVRDPRTNDVLHSSLWEMNIA